VNWYYIIPAIDVTDWLSAEMLTGLDSFMLRTAITPMAPSDLGAVLTPIVNTLHERDWTRLRSQLPDLSWLSDTRAMHMRLLVIPDMFKGQFLSSKYHPKIMNVTRRSVLLTPGFTYPYNRDTLDKYFKKTDDNHVVVAVHNSEISYLYTGFTNSTCRNLDVVISFFVLPDAFTDPARANDQVVHDYANIFDFKQRVHK